MCQRNCVSAFNVLYRSQHVIIDNDHELDRILEELDRILEELDKILENTNLDKYSTSLSTHQRSSSNLVKTALSLSLTHTHTHTMYTVPVKPLDHNTQAELGGTEGERERGGGSTP